MQLYTVNNLFCAQLLFSSFLKCSTEFLVEKLDMHQCTTHDRRLWLTCLFLQYKTNFVNISKCFQMMHFLRLNILTSTAPPFTDTEN